MIEQKSRKGIIAFAIFELIIILGLIGFIYYIKTDNTKVTEEVKQPDNTIEKVNESNSVATTNEIIDVNKTMETLFATIDNEDNKGKNKIVDRDEYKINLGDTNLSLIIDYEITIERDSIGIICPDGDCKKINLTINGKTLNYNYIYKIQKLDNNFIIIKTGSTDPQGLYKMIFVDKNTNIVKEIEYKDYGKDFEIIYNDTTPEKFIYQTDDYDNNTVITNEMEYIASSKTFGSIKQTITNQIPAGSAMEKR